MDINVTFTEEEFDDIIRSSREAQIRFSRLRTGVRAGKVDHWTEEECDAKIYHFLGVEQMLCARYKEATGKDW